MKQASILAAVLALAACAPQLVAGPLPPARLDGASIDVRSWGRLVHRWSVDSNGAVEHVSDSAPFGSSAKPLDIRKTTLDDTKRSALAAALVNVARIAAMPEGCTTRVTDMPYGKLTWSRGGQAHVLDWRSDCIEGRDAELWRAIKAADAIVDGAAMATPLAGTIANDEGGKGR